MRIAAVGVLVALGCLSAAARSHAGPGRPLEGEARDKPVAEKAALVGHWKLNPDLSEDPREKMRQAMEQAGRRGGGYPGGPGGGMGVPGGGPGGSMGGRGGGGHESRPGEGARPAGVAFLSATELTVTNVEPEISIVEPAGLVRNLHPDGKKYATSSGGEVRTRWDGERLRVETKSERGQVKETWSVSPQTRRLTVELEIQRGGMAPVSVRRVFDPAETDGGKP